MKFIVPNWDVPTHIRAFSSTRLDGVSQGVYHGLNLGTHVGDDLLLVERNRALLKKAAALPSSPIWLNQTHSNQLINVDRPTSQVLDADGAITTQANVVCAVMTADCLPVLLTDSKGSKVAAVHAGWRGLAGGIIENAVIQFDSPVIAWLGPAISKSAFEVGQDVFDIFVAHSSDAQSAFKPLGQGKYLADINELAKQRLHSLGVKAIYQSDLCTYKQTDTFYSYRRDGVTGRQATFIWIE